MEHSLEITEDTLYGLRLIKLLFNGGTERLRNFFDSRVPKLQQFLKVKEADIKSSFKEKSLTSHRRTNCTHPLDPLRPRISISLYFTIYFEMFVGYRLPLLAGASSLPLRITQFKAL